MMQFVMVCARASVQLPPQVHLRPLEPSDELLAEAAREYFGSAACCRLLVDASGRSESLIAEAWEAQRLDQPVEDTALAKVTAQLIRSDSEFACWRNSDFRDLPLVSSWDSFLAELRCQTRGQPGGFWVRYLPASRRWGAPRGCDTGTHE